MLTRQSHADARRLLAPVGDGRRLPPERGLRGGFTLTETLTVMVIVAILAALVLPIVSSLRAKAQASQCVTNLRQLAAAAHLYVQDHDGKFPTSYLYHYSTHTYPGVRDYISVKLGDSIYKCPTLERDNQFDAAHLKDTGGNTYSANVTATSNDDPSGKWAKAYLSRIASPNRTAWIMDGAWAGAFFNSVVSRKQLHYLERLQYPHSNCQNVIFVDGHVESYVRGSIPTDPEDVFWTGQ